MRVVGQDAGCSLRSGSAARIKVCRGTSKASASNQRRSRDGAYAPFSTRLTDLRSNFARLANSSWLSPSALRRDLTAAPKARLRAGGEPSATAILLIFSGVEPDVLTKVG